MSFKYEMVKAMTGDLVALKCHGMKLKAHNETSIWHTCKARSDYQCVLGGPGIKKGDICWSPLTFGGNRYHRISTAGMAQLVQKLYEEVGLAARGQPTRVDGGKE